MTDSVRKADYFYVEVANKVGAGATCLEALRDAGVNLLAFTGFPAGRKAQMDFIPEDTAAFARRRKRTSGSFRRERRCSWCRATTGSARSTK
jgi:hypothetical protein